MRRVLEVLRAAVMLLLAQIAVSAGARGAAELVEAGNKAFEAGLVPEAISQYESARDKPGGSAVPLFNMGVALVRQENYPAALTAFQSLSEAEGELAPLIHYNQGNVLARLGQMLASEDPQSAVEVYTRSVAAYQRALTLDLDLLPAAYNLEVVRTWIAELLDSGAAGGEGGSPEDSIRSGEKQRQNGTPSPGDGQGEEPDGSPAPDPAPDRQPDQPPEPELSSPADNPWAQRDETAQAILEEERRRREEEATWSGGESSDGKPNW